MENRYFESQSFITKWLMLLLLVFFGIELKSLYEIYMASGSLRFGVPFWIIVVVFIGFLFMRLKVTIDNEGININFLPFVIRKLWKWDDIDNVYIKEYSLMDYGGWGFRRSSKGIAYTTKGKFGVQIILKSGKRYLIGTQNPDEVKAILSTFFKSKDEE